MIPVILCGGSGARLWPLSRRSFPKQFVPLIGGKSLFQLTLERLAAVSQEMICVASEDHRFLVADALESASVSGSVILESVPRNTAVAMGLAALHAQRVAGDDALLLFCPADHHIPDVEVFCATIGLGCRAAESGAIVTFGVVPTAPITAYGYIQLGDSRADGSYNVLRFLEKPDAEGAAELIDQGDVLWNTGIYLVRADVLLLALQEHEPQIYSGCRESIGAAVNDRSNMSPNAVFVRPEPSALENCRPQSIDRAVMEKQEGLVVVPLDTQWRDVGSWTEVAELSARDERANRGVGQGLALHANNTYIHAPHRPVVALGVEDLLIVDTPDAVLVAHGDYAEQVKEVVVQLDCPQATSHRKAYRPWGWYDSIDLGPRFQVKRLMIKSGASLSLQMHQHRAEHWIVVQGTAEVTRGSETFLLTENQSAYIPLGVKHRLANHGRLPLEIIEVQSGSYLGEDDIERFEDDYGRLSS